MYILCIFNENIKQYDVRLTLPNKIGMIHFKLFIIFTKSRQEKSRKSILFYTRSYAESICTRRKPETF